ncbi:DUF3429 domain-containing protein [Microbulbifer sp. SAOS-129_SWC]|uniref:DUF3429 domain-containing protein n=1 Tax=Microbulbifer sp. SAOS-129_SWC TaxID=3145235 RepID=UPI0032172691
MASGNQTSPVRKTRLFDALAYLGLLPFVLGILMQATGVEVFGVGGRLWFAAYSAVILSFLCGIWWGGALNRVAHRHRIALAVLSNLVCVGGWVALLLYRTPWALPLLALGYAFVVTAEARLNPNLPRLYDYFRTRSRVTYLVIGCHLIMIVTILFTD